MLRRGQAMLPFFLLAWVLRLTQALASAHDPLQDEAAANSMSGTGNLDRGGNLSLPTDLAIPSAEDLFSKQDYFSPNGEGELSEIAGYSADQQRQSLDHVFFESDATNNGLFDFSQHYRYDEDALEQPVFSNLDSDDFNSDLTKNSVPFAADDYPMVSNSEGDVEHALFTDRSNDPDDFSEVFAYADLPTSDKENVSNTATLALNDSVINLAAEMGIGELGKEFDSSDHKSGTYSETPGYDSAAFADLEKEGTDTLHPDVRSYHKDQVTGDVNGMHVSSFDRSVLTDINLELHRAGERGFKIASASNSPDLSEGHGLPSSLYGASVGLYGVFNLPITPENPPPHSTGEPITLASATTCGVADMTIKLFDGRLTDLKVQADFILVEVSKITQRCRYKVFERNGVVHFTTAFKGCNVKALDGCFALNIKFQHADRVMGEVSALCHAGGGPKPTSQPDTPTTRDVTSGLLSTVIPVDVSATICNKDGMTVVLPKGPWWGIRVKDQLNRPVKVIDAPKSCNYSLVERRGQILFTAPYSACDVKILNGNYVLAIIYATYSGDTASVQIECPTTGEPTKPPPSTKPIPPTPVCGASSMMVELPEGPLEQVKIMNNSNGLWVAVKDVPKNCNYKKPPPSTKPIPPTPVCGASSMIVELPEGPLEQVKIMNVSNGLWVAVKDVPKNCNYTLMKERGRNLFITSYKACHVWILNEKYFLALRYTTIDGKVGYVQMECPTSAGEPTKEPVTTNTTRKSTRTPPAPDVVCISSGMMVELPKDSLDLVELLDYSNKWVAVNKAPVYCNYTLLQGSGRTLFITPYKACDVRILNENYILTLRYTTSGQQVYVHMKCPTSAAAPTKTPSSTTTTGKPPIPTVCKASVMTIELPEGPIEQVALIDKSNTLVTVKDDTRKCGYSLVHGRGKNIFTTPYTACDVKMLNGNYVLTLAYVSLTGKRVLVQMKCPTSAALPTGLPLPPFGVSVLCSDTCMTVELPGGLLQDIQLMDESNNLVAVTSAPKTCGYSLVRRNGKNILTAPYKACNVKILNNFYILRVLYTTLTGERGDIQAKCPVPGLVPREGCKIPRSQQVACGPPNADPQLCVANGCCVDATTSQCYYPLNACTADGHFVFSVDRTSTKPEIDPGSLVIAGNRSCAPVICTPDFAIFKFPVTGCGTHVFTVAETTIYLAEVHGLVRGNQQMYGQITRDGPYRFQVECRYSKGHLASTGYLVVNPPPPSAALAFGSLGVRLRIATDMPVPVDLGVGGRCAGKPCPGKSNVVKRAAHGHTGLIAVGEGTFLDEPVPHEQMGK
ncbi:UNVERIFIED_CONTAM: hypothetical protein FKN15_010934 [Acipenser sinensis]